MKNDHTRKIMGEASEKQNLGNMYPCDVTDGASGYMEKYRFDDIFSGIVLRRNNWGMLE